MSWDAWAQQITKNGANQVCAIIAKDGTSVWGKSGDFSLSAYETEIDDGEGGTKKVSVNEGQRIVQALAAKGVPTKEMIAGGGLFISQKKYRTVRYPFCNPLSYSDQIH